MNKNTNKTTLESHFYYLKKLLGLILIIIGIPGLFLPIIPGMVLIVTGIILIGNRKLLEKLKHLKNHLKEKSFKKRS